MKILLLDQYSDPGGAQQVLLELLPAIRNRGWQALVGMPGTGDLFARVRAMGFESETIECGPYASGRKSWVDLLRFARGTPRLARRIAEMAERLGADLLYVNGPRVLPAVALADPVPPVLFHAHSYLARGVIRRLTGLCLRRSRAWVVSNCEFVARPWREYVAEDRVSVVYNGVTEAPLPPARQSASASGGASHRGNHHSEIQPRVGCMGRIAPEKGQREFVAAAQRIHQAVPECRFVIYGAALFSNAGSACYEAEVRAAAAALPVEFTGWVTDVWSALAGLDLLLVPSAAQEATTRVILEAYAAGVPVIASRAGGIPEVVQHGVDGLLAGSTEEMAEQAIQLLRDRSRLYAMSVAARETWRRRFTLEGYHAQILGLMERIAGST